MKFTNEDSLYNYIAELMIYSNIDFVACPIISPWHAIGVDALVYDISQHKREKPSGIVVITPHLRGKFTINEETFACRDFANMQFCYLDSTSKDKELTMSGQIHLAKTAFNILLAIKRLRQTKKDSRQQMHIITAMFPNVFVLQAFKNKTLASKYYPIFSLVDEGIGTCMPEKSWRTASELTSPNNMPRYFQLTRFLRVKMMYNASNVLKLIGGKGLAIQKWFLLKNNHDKLTINEQYITLYKKALAQKAGIHKKRNKERPTAMIITTYWRYDDTPLAGELDLMEGIINILIESGFSVVIKPHPTEPANKYGYILSMHKQVNLAPQEVLAEVLFARLKPDCVIGYDSSALLYANVIYNIPTIRITDMLLSKLDAEAIDASWELFKKLTKGTLYNANSFEELKVILPSCTHD